MRTRKIWPEHERMKDCLMFRYLEVQWTINTSEMQKKDDESTKDYWCPRQPTHRHPVPVHPTSTEAQSRSRRYRCSQCRTKHYFFAYVPRGDLRFRPICRSIAGADQTRLGDKPCCILPLDDLLYCTRAVGVLPLPYQSSSF